MNDMNPHQGEGWATTWKRIERRRHRPAWVWWLVRLFGAKIVSESDGYAITAYIWRGHIHITKIKAP